jgi:hypothetical protein
MRAHGSSLRRPGPVSASIRRASSSRRSPGDIGTGDPSAPREPHLVADARLEAPLPVIGRARILNPLVMQSGLTGFVPRDLGRMIRMRCARMPMWTGLIVLLVAACSSAGGAIQPKAAAQGSASHPPASRTHQAPPSPPSPSSPAPPPPPPQVTLSSFRAADGTVITLARFSGPVIYRLHSGSADPGSAALRVVQAGPSVPAGEQQILLAAF